MEPRPYLNKQEDDELADYLVQTAQVGYEVHCLESKSI